jgi:cysteinyl-tRNA synthetase
MKSNLWIYNTLTQQKDLLEPMKNRRINLFVCGPTVYDFSHIGHARTYIIFDCFAKFAKSQGFKVYYLQNITDIDDKIIVKSKEKGVLPKDLAEAFYKDYLKDMKLLGVSSVTKYAKATLHIKEIISQIQRLTQKGYAYQLGDGIYFDISKFKGYGKLSGRTSLQAEDAVSRIDYSTQKRNRGDFCLWKFNEHSEGEPSWPSLFGKGRPGWHIEDTAITEKYFGPQYDIHGGGRDLIFPHHEAEITQMEAISEKSPMAKYWMHTGFLTINGQKMSKSLNNGITIGDFIKRYSSQQLRFWIVKNLWRAPMDYSEGGMIEVKAALEKIEEFLRKILRQNSKLPKTDIQELIRSAKERFYSELRDDFNTPKAFAVLFEFIKAVNTQLENHSIGKKEANAITVFFKEINAIFGIIDFKKLKQSNIPNEVKNLLAQREKYRKAQDWQKADETRKEIEKYGFIVDDTPSGPAVKKKI